mgnify:CR=1 FL=1
MEFENNSIDIAIKQYLEKLNLEEKIKIVKEFKNGATISYLMKKYNIPSWGTVSVWNKKYDEGKLGEDNRGKRKSQQEVEDIEILKKSYALLMEIRSQQHK